MGLFSKSLLILLVAVSTPLLYRRFATDETVRSISSYYSNYKVIDHFLRQSAMRIDRARSYLPDADQIQDLSVDLQMRLKEAVETIKDRIIEFKGNREVAPEKADDATSGTAQTSYRMSDCPGEDNAVRLWSKAELSKFDGSSSDEVYLGFLGIVYNVTINSQHYGPGAEYSVFAGRDATRAFVTGNFTHDLSDNLIGIDQNFYNHIESWASFYGSSYQALGRIEGAFFDSRGCGTSELARVYQIFSDLAQERSKKQEENKILPECNSEWNADLKSGHVWCTTKSGGVERDWAGVPRLHEDENEPATRCVCVNQEILQSDQQNKFKTYPGCDPDASDCQLK